MFTLEDLNNLVAFLLEEQGPLTPVEIRQFLDRLAEEHCKISPKGATQFPGMGAT